MHLEQYHAKRQRKFQERKHTMSKAEKRHFHIKTQHKLEHIAIHGKNGQHRDDYDSRHQNLSKEQKQVYKKQRKELNQRHRQNETYNSKEHLHNLKQHQDNFYKENAPKTQSDDAKAHGNHAESSEKADGEPKENKSRFPTPGRKVRKRMRQAKSFVQAGVVGAAGTTGFLSRIIASANSGAAKNLSGVAEHVQGQFQNGVQHAGDAMRRTTSGGNTKSDGVNFQRGIASGSSSPGSGSDASSPSPKSSFDDDASYTSSGSDDKP
jgi:hypothetical protein